MTKIFETSKKCFMCGAKSLHSVLASSSSFGSPDLDLRRPGMIRYAMSHWVQACPECGYVAQDIGVKNPLGKTKIKAIMATKAYKDGAPFDFDNHLSIYNVMFPSKSEIPLAFKFYRKYLLDMASNDLEAAFRDLHCCAWDCDDFKLPKTAKAIRKLAVPLLNKLIRKSKDHEKDTFLLIRADLLRRSHQYSRVIKLYSEQKFTDKVMNKMCAFQVDRAMAKDDKCYQIRNAMRKRRV